MVMKKTRSNHYLLSAHTQIQHAAFWQASLLISILLICGCVASAQSIDRALSSRNTLATPQARERVRQVIPAVGLVLVRNGGNSDADLRPRGSAVVVRKDGLVATNFHVVARDKTQRIYEDLFLTFALEPGVAATSAPRRYRLKPLLLNQERDLALLRILSEDGKELPTFQAIELGDAQKLELLDEIAIIGFPEKGGTTVTVNTGVVEGKDSLDAWIKTDARLIHGNSGGAAVNGEGKLIGIPTRVVVDSDGEKSYGAVGYLRPSYLVASMISKYQETESNSASAPDKPKVATMVSPATDAPPTAVAKNVQLVTVRGLVKTSDGKVLAGVRVGLLNLGQELNESTLITWGGSNADGQFELEKPVPPGRYTLRAKAIGYAALSVDVEVGPATAPIVLELRPSSQDE